MAVFRVEKTSNYTIMANYHLKSRVLSLKAKGLLSVMLSLPDEWDYTLKGLSVISREGVDAIREAIKELEAAGYIVRTRYRNERGQLGAAEYVIYEVPQPVSENPTQVEKAESQQEQGVQASPVSDAPTLDAPMLASPALETPMLENPMQANPVLENPTQLKTKESRTYSETYPGDKKPQRAIHPSIKDPSIHPVNMDQLRAEVELQLDYETLCYNHKYDVDRLDEIMDLIMETLCSTRPTIAVAGDEFPADLVKGRLRKLNGTHIDYVLDSIKKTTTEVRNIKRYLLTALFNAPATMSSYYTADFQHSFYGGGGNQGGRA